MIEAGIEVRNDSKADDKINERLMHNKIMIVDSKFVLMGSFNWTENAELKNYENVMILDGDYFIKSYEAEFEKLWKKFEYNA